MDEKPAPVISENQPIQESAVSPPLFSKKLILTIAVFIIVILIVGVSAFYMGARTQNNTATTIVTPTIVPSPTQIVIPTQPTIADSLFTGKLTKLNQDLGVIKINAAELSDDPNAKVVYFSAGTYLKGQFTGYTRILALKQAYGPVENPTYILATKDFKSYILDPSYIPSNTDYDSTDIDTSKITETKPLDSEHIDEIDLDSHFSLSKQSIFSIYVPTGEINKNNQPVTELSLLINKNNLINLSPANNLQLYSEKNAIVKQLPSQQDEKDLVETSNKYIVSSTEVDVFDSTGLGYRYNLSDKKTIEKYKIDKAAYEVSISKKDYSNAHFVQAPHLKITQDQINSDKAKFKDYETALPRGCGINTNTSVVNLQDSDLQPFGSTLNYQLYTLKDSNHPLYKAEYYDKVSLSLILNKEPAPYTFSEYVAKNPLLFFKDHWNRWVMVGEFDLQLASGCGKPVLYLYPPLPTKVQISFNTAMQLTTAIPTYHNVWNVLAQPNGVLTDLQPEYTDCAKIDSSKKGSEYATQACTTNQYPYIYWAGNSLEKAYPTISQGWYVSQNDLGVFMNQKLDEVGLTQKEKSDMLEYWLPEMLQKNSPYYRISFLQTKEMNEMIPMNFTPAPSTFFRIFLDYLPLTSKPTSSIQPQTLQKIQRTAFTVVEWGGLKR